jgi:hypothetical protein
VSDYDYIIVPTETFHVETGKAEKLWEVHYPAGSRVASFRTYGGACKYVLRHSGERYTGCNPGPVKGDKKTP